MNLSFLVRSAIYLAALLTLGHVLPCKAAQQLAPTWTIPLYSHANVSPAKPAPASNSPATASVATNKSQSIYSIGLFGHLVEVPALKGKTWDEATILLAQKNLVGVKTSTVARGDDIVRNQNVVAGKMVVPGTEVKLFLVGEVPNVVGLTLSAAYEVLEAENGFPMKYNSEWPSDLKVTVQDPKAGAKHSRGRDVEVASMVEVPKLLGITIAEAKDLLTNSNLYAEISTEFFLDEDRVLSQNPKEGRMAPAFSKIKVVPGAEVPDLIGLSPSEADRALRSSGIQGKPYWRQVATYDSFAHGRARVTKQSIRSGSYVARGTHMRVNLVRYIYRQQVIVLPPKVIRDPTDNRGGEGGLGEGGFGGGGGG